MTESPQRRSSVLLNTDVHSWGSRSSYLLFLFFFNDGKCNIDFYETILEAVLLRALMKMYLPECLKELEIQVKVYLNSIVVHTCICIKMR